MGDGGVRNIRSTELKIMPVMIGGHGDGVMERGSPVPTMSRGLQVHINHDPNKRTSAAEGGAHHTDRAGVKSCRIEVTVCRPEISMVPGQVGRLKARPRTKNPRSRIAPDSCSQNLDASGAVLSRTPLSASPSDHRGGPAARWCMQ